MKQIELNECPLDTPPVPTGYKIYILEDGRVCCKSPPDKRKSRERVPKQPRTFWLCADEKEGGLCWLEEGEYQTTPIREWMLGRGLESEVLFGMRMTAKAPKCSTILRQEYSMKGTPVSLYMQYSKFQKLKINPKMAEKALAEGVA
jgi:hypothetical protein